MRGRSRLRRGRARGTKPSSELPSELRGLDRDLRTIVIEERCSFGVELRATLAAERRRIQDAGPHRAGRRRRAVAAGAVVLGVAGAIAAPSARASLARWFAPAPRPEPQAQPLPPPAPVAPTEARPEPQAEPMPARLAPLAVASDARVPWVAPPATLPGLLDPDEARRTVAREYPPHLQGAGVGGTVRVLLWVQPGGDASQARVAESSGAEGLDSAALRAIRSFRFRPATHNGRSVGTWVEFSIRFRPYAPDSQPGPEYQPFHIPLSN